MGPIDTVAPVAPFHDGFCHERPDPSSPAVILLHGVTGGPAEMGRLAKALYSGGFSTYVPRLAGHGSIEELRVTPLQAWLEASEQMVAEVAASAPRRLYLAGLSFGSLLSLYLLSSAPESFGGAALFSVPFCFRSRREQLLLTALSRLPEQTLNRFGTIPKRTRAEGIFLEVRESFPMHSLAAAARLFKLRRRIIAKLPLISCPVLIIQDPEDHHLDAGGALFLQRRLRGARTSLRWYPGAEHEVTIGRRRDEIISATMKFFMDLEIEVTREPLCPAR